MIGVSPVFIYGGRKAPFLFGKKMTDIQYKIIRSDRKSMALIIDSEARLTVRAPLDARESEIKDLVKQKKRWIIEKQKKISGLNNKHSPVTFKNGESFIYQGETYTIKYDNVSKIKISDTNIIVPRTFKKERIISWLKREAKKLISARLDKYASLMGVRYSALRISGARTRWGSCSGRDSLNFTWRLIMCPITAIDYVIIHELCHITYKNHSPAFWAMVKRICPKFKEPKNWLKNNRKLMDII
jgi:predicted metal-dependent hydrolase